MNKPSRRGSAARRRRRSRRSRGGPVGIERLRRQNASRRWHRELEAQCAALSLCCPDRGSQIRLRHLRTRLASYDRGISESALAELELAALLMRAGFQIGFLPESQSKTADLECIRAGNRFFVEVTSMVGFARRRAHVLPHVRRKHEEDVDQEIFTGRIMARIRQKAKQLADYCAPVLLAITLPPADREERQRGRGSNRVMPDQEVDLKRMAGAITVMLPLVRQVSGVLLSLWDVEPSVDRSGVRLANVHVVERPRGHTAFPRTRLLILNPTARVSFGASEIESLRALL